jgi:putative membrane protein
MFHFSDIFILLSAVSHLGFMYLECFLWTKPAGRKRFGLSEEKAQITAPLAFNQGIYNLFLTAGLIFAQFYRGEANYMPTTLFFLGCIIVAGIVGGKTVSSRIFFIQALPAIIGAGLLLAGF